MRVIIDRFESEFAVCETKERTMINIEISKLPKGAKEDDVLIVQHDSITIDIDQTQQRKKEIETLADGLWE